MHEKFPSEGFEGIRIMFREVDPESEGGYEAFFVVAHIDLGDYCGHGYALERVFRLLHNDPVLTKRIASFPEKYGMEIIWSGAPWSKWFGSESKVIAKDGEPVESENGFIDWRRVIIEIAKDIVSGQHYAWEAVNASDAYTKFQSDIPEPKVKVVTFPLR